MLDQKIQDAGETAVLAVVWSNGEQLVYTLNLLRATMGYTCEVSQLWRATHVLKRKKESSICTVSKTEQPPNQYCHQRLQVGFYYSTITFTINQRANAGCTAHIKRDARPARCSSQASRQGRLTLEH
jgi:hypothetical protein